MEWGTTLIFSGINHVRLNIYFHASEMLRINLNDCSQTCLSIQVTVPIVPIQFPVVEVKKHGSVSVIL
jgi:hypothetical protein